MYHILVWSWCEIPTGVWPGEGAGRMYACSPGRGCSLGGRLRQTCESLCGSVSKVNLAYCTHFLKVFKDLFLLTVFVLMFREKKHYWRDSIISNYKSCYAIAGQRSLFCTWWCARVAQESNACLRNLVKTRITARWRVYFSITQWSMNSIKIESWNIMTILYR